MVEYIEDSKSSSIIFEYQVGGHHTIFRHPDKTNLIIKPSVTREIAFYRGLKESSHPLLQHVPMCHTDDQELKLTIEDLTFGMASPNILDVKIGARLYDIDATSVKIQKRVQKTNTTSSGRHGFRLCGIRTQVLGLLTKTDLCSIDDASIVRYLDHFFASDFVRSRVVDALNRIKETVVNSYVELISSSILIVYDEFDPTTMKCKMIDFAHSHLHEKPHYDQNYLEGLASFCKFVAK